MNPTIHVAVDEFFRRYLSHRYRKGHIFLVANEVTHMISYLVEGRVKVYDVNYRGDEIIIESYGPGVFFPASQLLTNKPTRYIHEAASDVVIYQAPMADFRQFLQEHPTLSMDLLTILYNRFDKILERMVHFVASSAKHRLIYAIVEECRQFGIAQDDGSYIIEINEKELGSRAGLTRETVNREARSLKVAHMIEVTHQQIIVRHLSHLERYLDLHA